MKTLIALLFFTTVVPSWARLIESWDYQKLTESADIILIAAPIKAEETKEIEVVPRMFIGGLKYSKPVKAYVSLTTFSVQSVLKGKLSKKQIILRHLRVPESLYSERVTTGVFYVNGPSFVSFDTKSNDCYLLFLKKLPNGQYISITGQTDPEFGIKRLNGYPGIKDSNAEQVGAHQPATRRESKSE